jgi:hypothetical protein
VASKLSYHSGVEPTTALRSISQCPQPVCVAMSDVSVLRHFEFKCGSVHPVVVVVVAVVAAAAAVRSCSALLCHMIGLCKTLSA